MSETKTALITGITGQSGSFLAELLLEKNYEVYGLVRRLSTPNVTNISHILDDINILQGDITDCSSLDAAVLESKPEEVYHLGAMSFVGASWNQPILTADVTGLGTLRVLEALHKYDDSIKFYNAASSEMFGEVLEMPQTEKTPLNPRSPYAVAKVFGYHITKNYRESYGIHASSGILFNHESVPSYSPVIINIDDKIDILPISELFKAHRWEGLLDKYKNAKVWNGDEFVQILRGTCYQDRNKKLLNIQTVSACVETTYDHVIFTDNNIEVEAKNLNIGDIVDDVKLPTKIGMNLSKDLAKCIGYIVGDGYVSKDGGTIRIIGKDINELQYYATIMEKLFMCKSNTYYNDATTEFGSVGMYNITFSGILQIGKWLREEIYTQHKKKRIPQFILNSDTEIKAAFFDGYYDADGRKAGNERYTYKGWTTNSATLNLGLVYLINDISGQIAKTKLSVKNGHKYYYTYLRSPDSDTDTRGDSVKKNLNEIISIYDTINEDGWFFDLQTETQDFATGANLVRIHNSPKRGIEFVTRKITNAVAQIAANRQETLHLGNLDAKRDWGYAGDYVEAMYLMLQQFVPGDYVISSGAAHSVREFVELAFKHAGVDIGWYGSGTAEKGIDTATGDIRVAIDPAFYRPAEVDILLGDSTKAFNTFGWKPKTTFEELVKMMVDNDMKLAGE